jgi:energy-coupling factor transport system substrate-specific component
VTVAVGRPKPVVRVGTRSAVVLAAGSVLGLAMFCWPLLVQPSPGGAHASDAPFVFLLCMPLLVAVTLTALADGTIDVRGLAILGVLAGVGAALRPLGAGTGGIELVFFLLVLAGRVFGPGFGFVLGASTLFASALLTAGVGPWLPFQMLAAAWVGCGAGLLPQARGRAELALLSVYGVVSAYAYGLLLDLWAWPFTFGRAGAAGASGLSYVPGDPVVANLRRFLLSTVATSTLGWDTGRALTNVVAIIVIGGPVLAVLRRTVRRAAFDAPVSFAPGEGSTTARLLRSTAEATNQNVEGGGSRSDAGADPQP